MRRYVLNALATAAIATAWWIPFWLGGVQPPEWGSNGGWLMTFGFLVGGSCADAHKAIEQWHKERKARKQPPAEGGKEGR
jgi:hypothetical protein